MLCPEQQAVSIGPGISPGLFFSCKPKRRVRFCGSNGRRIARGVVFGGSHSAAPYQQAEQARRVGILTNRMLLIPPHMEVIKCLYLTAKAHTFSTFD
jgi:hypothetical protein